MYNVTGLERPNRVQESARRCLCRLPKPRERRFKWPPFNHIQRKKQVKNCLCPTCKGQKSWTLHPIFSFHLTFFLFPVSFFPFFFFGSTHSFSSERTKPYPYHQSISLLFFIFKPILLFHSSALASTFIIDSFIFSIFQFFSSSYCSKMYLMVCIVKFS